MADTRHKNANWNLNEKPDWRGVTVAVLMDIRDELQKLNHLLHCHRFTGIPETLHRIDRRVAKKIRLR